MTQKAAVFTGNKDLKDLIEISTIDIPQVEEDQILIKAVAVAANPTDWKHALFFGSGKGLVVGSDVAGVVEKVGSKVKGFEEGDYATGFLRGNYFPGNGAFSEYVAIYANTALKLNKSNVSDSALSVGTHKDQSINTFEAASSLPLGLATIALSFTDNFKLKPGSKGSILIWGGATATGLLAIQVAKLVYGLDVVTVASSKHHTFLKSIGADSTYDYNDSDIVSKLQSHKFDYAYDTVSTESTWQSVYDGTANSPGVHLDNLLFLDESKLKTDSSRDVKFHTTLVYIVSGKPIEMPGQTLQATAEQLEAFDELWQKLLPPHLDQLKTNLKVLEPGLNSAAEALQLLYDGKVSGEKVVFRV